MKVRAAVNRTAVGTQSGVGADSQVYTAGLTVIAVTACAIGLWAAASLVGGMIASGGPIALAGDWFKAVFGI